MAELTTNIAGIKFRNPVLTASGTFGFGEEFADLVDFSEIGGIITKGTTLLPREGNDYPRMAETAAGMLNCVGLQNGGVEHFCNDIYPRIKDYDTNIIVNVAGSSPETYAACAERLAPLDKIPAIELNISCPNVKQGGMAFGVTAEGAQSVVRAVRKAYPKPVRMVWQVARAVKIPVIGLGGIMTAEDAIEFFMAGASAIEIGTANFVDPQATVKIARGIDAWLDAHNCKSLGEIIGAV